MGQDPRHTDGERLEPAAPRASLTRRQALQSAVVASASLAGGGLLAACSSSDSGPSTAAGGGTAARGVQGGGSLRVGIAGGGAEDTIDAHVPLNGPDVARVFQLYEPVAIRDANFDLQMVLAESIEPSHGLDAWTIRLRPDLTFHDGRPVRSEDLLFTLRRILDPKNPGRGAASLDYVDLARSRKLDERTLQVALNIPNVSFPDDVGQYWNGVVPVGYDPKQPIGTGPFAYKSFTPGEQSLFTRNSDYWRGDQPHVDEIKIIDFPDDTARVNALLGGQVDAIDNLPGAQIGQLQANSDVVVLTSETGSWQPFTMRMDQPPFNDVRVRQAFRLIVDREQMIAQALNGQGRVANDLYAPYDPAYAGDLPQRTQDLEQAKSLLKAAGQSDLTVEVTTSPVFHDLVQTAQVFAQQAEGAGVSVKVNRVDTGTFYGPNYLKWSFAQDYWFTRNYLQQAAQSTLPQSPYNETHWEDRRYDSLVAQAQREGDPARRKELLHEAQQLEYERGGYIVWSFSNQVDAYSAKVAGFQPAKSAIPLTNYGFGRVGFVG